MQSLFSSRITKLDDALSNQIAAGEVVERPSAALKELVENSLDAGATTLRVSIREGGVKLLEVVDDGHGIHPEDLRLALDRHATSKIRETKDLFAIHTWGFRGEALASIGAVSRLKLSSRHKDFPVGREIVCEATQLKDAKEITRTVGTTIEVSELFFNTPARRKFLKSQASETSACAQTLHRLALASPEVSFEFWIDGKKSFHFPAVKKTEERVAQVFREAFNLEIGVEELIPFSKNKPDASVHGFLLPTKYFIPSSRGIFLFVNKRSVKDKVLQQAVMTAAKEVLFGSAYPQLALYLETSPESVDVNVHPTKSEVRFRNSSQIFGLIRSTVEEALAKTRPAMPEDISFPSPSTPMAAPSFSFEAPTHFHQKADIEQEVLSPPALARGPQFLGTLKNTYLVCQDDEGLLLVDQHAAHERVSYEKLRKQRLARTESAQLLIPIIVEVPERSADLLEAELGKLSDLGLELDRSGPTQISVRAIPPLLLRGDGTPRISFSKLVKELAATMEHENAPDIVADEVKKVMLDGLASESCHGSVRAGKSLSPMEAHHLLAQMDQTDFAGHCPHGRPTTLRLDWRDIEKMFKRIV